MIFLSGIQSLHACISLAWLRGLSPIIVCRLCVVLIDLGNWSTAPYVGVRERIKSHRSKKEKRKTPLSRFSFVCTTPRPHLVNSGM